MSNQITGVIKLINPTQTFDSGFKKREFVVTTKEQFPQDLKFELVKDKCSEIEKFKVGESVTVSPNIGGTEDQGKDFVSLQAWKIAASGQDATPQPPAPVSIDADEDDLPF